MSSIFFNLKFLGINILSSFEYVKFMDVPFLKAQMNSKCEKPNQNDIEDPYVSKSRIKEFIYELINSTTYSNKQGEVFL